MPLAEVPLDPELSVVPATVHALVADAQARIADFVAARKERKLHGFVPSDFTAVYRALREIDDRGLATGRRLCEWGSGFGVVAILAAQLGYEAAGIEIEDELVDEAEALAADHGADVAFACGTFVPEGGDDLVADTGDIAWLAAAGADGYDELAAEPADFDIVFAYPWPGEEGAVERLFEAFAADGALLVTYRGLEGVRAHRKTRVSADP